MIKIDSLQENKEKIIVIVLIGLNLIFFYFCSIIPYNRLKLKKETVREFELKLKKFSKEKEIVEKIYNSKIEKEKEIERKFNESREKIVTKSFKNIGEFEKTILERLKKHNLYSQIIGRVEKLNNEIEGKAYISYEIIGKEKNIKKFIQELENGEKLISLVETPVYIEIKEEESKIKLKIAGYILNLLEKEQEKIDIEKVEEVIEEKILFISFDEVNILEKKILNLNKNRYLLLKYKKGGRDIFCEDEEIEKDGKKYRIKIKEDGIYLDSGEIR
jgi:hypothetical protein